MHESDVVALAWRPDGRELAASSLNGNLTLWDVSGPSEIIGTIEGRKDLKGGRLSTQRITANNSDSAATSTLVWATSLIYLGSLRRPASSPRARRVMRSR